MYSNIVILGVFLLTSLGNIFSSHIQKESELPYNSSSGVSLGKKKHSGEKISITFDDGPNPLYTPEILRILREKSVPATFFVLGNRIAGNEKILLQMKDEGHEIANHSYIHPKFSKIPTLRYLFEVTRTAGMIWSITGDLPIFFRFPYGIEDARIGYLHSGPIIGWNVDAYDWKIKNSHDIARSIINQTKSGSIILLHDIKKDTIGALPTIITTLENEGYDFVSLKSLIGWKSGKEYKNTLFYSSSYSRKVRASTYPSLFSSEGIRILGVGSDFLTPKEKIFFERILE